MVTFLFTRFPHDLLRPQANPRGGKWPGWVPGKMVGIFLQIQVFFHDLETTWVEKLP